MSKKDVKAKKSKGSQAAFNNKKRQETQAQESMATGAPPAALKMPKADAEVFVDSYELPVNYNTTRLTLVARDPHWIHAYWEIAPSSIEELSKRIGGELARSSLTLRMYDVTLKDFNGHNANKWFDIDIGPHTDNWYINLWDDNVTYCGEIGIRTPEGRFFAITRSNFVTTPRAGSSGRSDMISMEVKDNPKEQPLVFVEAGKKGIKSSSPSMGNQTSGAKRTKRKIYLTENDIRVYYSKLFPLLRLVASSHSIKGWGSEKSPKGGIFLEESLLRGLPPSQFIKKILLGASEELILQGGASELVREITKGGASEREQKQRKFFFEIGTELIVHGRTEPNAEVRLGNKKIKLRDDGTFTLRFALPDGKIPLDFVAKSHDKVEQKSITTAVERTRTIYGP